MILTERYQRILEMLESKQMVTVQELCESLYASPATIRRDLAALESYNLITRTHGGAVLYEGDSDEPAAQIRRGKNMVGKKKIAELLVPLIRDGSTVFMDCSSTVYYGAVEMLHKRDLTVITNGLYTASYLAGRTDWDIFFPAGKIENRSCSAVGPKTAHGLAGYNANAAVLSCTGLTPDGVTEASANQSDYKRVMLERSDIHILLCDHTKFDQRFFSRTGGLEDYHIVVTDQKPSREYLEKFRLLGIKTVYPKG